MVVVDAQYIEPYTVDLAVQRKSAPNSNGNFTVVDINGNLMFKIKDTRFSFHDRHILYDASEKPVLTFKKKIRSIHGRWQAFKGDSTTHKDLLFNVKKSIDPKHETELDVFLVENKEETISDCKVMGDWETKSCTIYAQDGSTVLAEVHDKQNIVNVVHGKDAFGITVYPEVDYVFIVALVVILTEIKSYNGSNKKKKKKKKGKKKRDNIDGDHDDDEKLKKITERNLERENFVQEDGDDDEEEEEEESDDDDEDDYDSEDDYSEDDEDVERDRDEDQDEDDDVDDYDNESYQEEPKFDEYDDDEEVKSSSSSSSSKDGSPTKS